MAIRESYKADRSQTTLMPAHKLRIPEVEIVQALECNTACELDFAGWELASKIAFRKPRHPDRHESLSFQFFVKDVMRPSKFSSTLADTIQHLNC